MNVYLTVDSTRRCLTVNSTCLCLTVNSIPAGSPSRGGDVAVYVVGINQPSLPTPFYSVLVSASVFTALSIVFHSLYSPDNCPLSHSVLPGLFCLIGPFNFFMKVSLSPEMPMMTMSTASDRGRRGRDECTQHRTSTLST